MTTITFLALLAVAVAVALVDWRKGWYATLLIGVLQDPARKLTPGQPAFMVLTAMVVYVAIIVGAAPILQSGARNVVQRYPRLYKLMLMLAFFLILAVVNGLLTFGLSQWQAPALSLFIYCAPIPAVVLGFVFIRREEDLLSLLKFYSVLTSVALIGVTLEFLRVNWPALGTVALGQDWIRHLPGVQVRILSGFYRSPDIMAWHAAMLSICALILMIRYGFPRGWLWMAVFGWGFVNCLMSGRRKMLYMIAVFSLVFLWRYWRRFTVGQILAFGTALLIVWFVVNELSTQSESTQVYTVGAKTTLAEILKRLEGGVIETFRQNGLFGAGLGAATQGARHVLSPDSSLGWQEGGAGKLALELGLPGFIFAVYFLIVTARLSARIAFARDSSGRLHLIRVALLGILAGNLASFLVSHQPYSDPLLVLMTAFFAGALLGTPKLIEDPTPDIIRGLRQPTFAPRPATAAARSVSR